MQLQRSSSDQRRDGQSVSSKAGEEERATKRGSGRNSDSRPTVQTTTASCENTVRERSHSNISTTTCPLIKLYPTNVRMNAGRWQLHPFGTRNSESESILQTPCSTVGHTEAQSNIHATCTFVYMLVFYTHTYIHPYIHTYTHAYVHTCIHT